MYLYTRENYTNQISAMIKKAVHLLKNTVKVVAITSWIYVYSILITY